MAISVNECVLGFDDQTTTTTAIALNVMAFGWVCDVAQCLNVNLGPGKCIRLPT